MNSLNTQYQPRGFVDQNGGGFINTKLNCGFDENNDHPGGDQQLNTKFVQKPDGSRAYRSRGICCKDIEYFCDLCVEERLSRKTQRLIIFATFDANRVVEEALEEINGTGTEVCPFEECDPDGLLPPDR